MFCKVVDKTQGYNFAEDIGKFKCRLDFENGVYWTRGGL